MALDAICSCVWIILLSVTLLLVCLSSGSLQGHWLTDLLRLAIHGKSLDEAESSNSRSSTNLRKRFFSLKVRKSLFTHMYVVGLVGGLLCTWIAHSPERFPSQLPSSRDDQGSEEQSLLVVYLFIIQVTRRLLECLFITEYGSSEMHVAAYLVGILHYIFVPLTLLSSSKSQYGLFRVFISLLLFSSANILQFLHHYILWRLKRSNQTHALPRGLLFEYVCCAHYTMEIIVYVSFWLLCPSRSTLFLLLWVISNLSLVASLNMNWYRKRFPDAFEKERKYWKRLIPFIW